MYSANYNIFDNIDTEEKAYWLGFLWADGYICIRDRRNNGTYSYEIKLSLSECDIGHLEKFKQFLNLNNTIKIYENHSNFISSNNEARVMIYNKHMGEILCNKYGIIPNRNDIHKTLKHIPENLHKHFIRGILDADGSITFYQCLDQGCLRNKKCISITTNISVLDFINNYLYNNNISCSIINIYGQRHKNGDKDCRSITYTGNIQVPRVLTYLYKDSKIYLDRKYEKYKQIEI